MVYVIESTLHCVVSSQIEVRGTALAENDSDSFLHRQKAEG